MEIGDLFKSEGKAIRVINKHNEGKDNSILNGAVIILTDKKGMSDLIEHIKGGRK